MNNDSSTGGFLLSYRDSYIAPPLEGQALTNFLQEQIVGVTGIAGNLVRPRWQPEPPLLPDATIDWIAFGITERKGQTYAYTYHETPHLDETRTLDNDIVETQFLDTNLQFDMGLLLDQENEPDTLDPNSYDIVLRSEDITVLCSVYGPNADDTASAMREGFSVAQNREALQLNNVPYIGAGDITIVPSLVNNKWYYRVDIPLWFRRGIRRVYPILDIASANGTLNTDISPITRQIVINPPND